MTTIEDHPETPVVEDLVEFHVVQDPTAAAGYRPSQQLRDDVIAVWPHCTFPRCRQPAWRSDLDHRQEYDHEDPDAGGPTSLDNLQPLCRAHHRLKTFTDWDCAQDEVGTIHWTSPTGHEYQVHPDGYFLPEEWTTVLYSPPKSTPVFPWLPRLVADPDPEPDPDPDRVSNPGREQGVPKAEPESTFRVRSDLTNLAISDWPDEPPF